MATTKKTTKKTANEKDEVKEKTVTTPVEEAPVKKTTKKTTATKRTTTRKTTKKAVEPAIDFYIEYNGVQESYAQIIENVKKLFLAENEGVEIKSIKVYLKPIENAAYCVVNDNIEFRMDVYFA